VALARDEPTFAGLEVRFEYRPTHPIAERVQSVSGFG
jgi:hypothetical protein